MKLTTDEAFAKIAKEGITDNYYTFMKMVRDGRIIGTMTSKKKGYRFEMADIEAFIESYNEDVDYDAKGTVAKLEEENERLQNLLSMPKDYWMLENQKLKRMLYEKEKELEKAIDECNQLKAAQENHALEAKKTPRTATANTSDIQIQFNNKDIHPKQKQEILA